MAAMAIDQTNVVDFVGIEPNKNEAQLIISDHLEWDKGERADSEHMYLLQEKINSYLRFVESGEIYTSYPKSRGKKLVIRVVAKHDLNSNGKSFFQRIEETLFASGFVITFERLHAS
jgi:uncharacterized protein DUF6572